MTKNPTRRAPEPRVQPDFEFCLAGPALSAQTANRPRLRAWQSQVAEAARLAWPEGKPPLVAPLRVRITEFDVIRRRDRDNFAKPIADALQGIVYDNDKAIVTLESEWKDLTGAFVVRYMSRYVAEAFSVGDPFVRVCVWADDRAGDLD